MTKPRYFKQYPTFEYEVDRDKETSFRMKNIMLRSKVIDSVLRHDTAFYPYRMRDQDRPDTIAQKYYGSSEFFWVVFYSNNAFDLYYDFPIARGSFDNYLYDKYKDLEAAADSFFNGVNGAPGGIKERVILYLNEVNHHYLDGEGYEVDVDTYNADGSPNKRDISIYTYEVEANEAKRDIRLLDERLLAQFVTEVEDSLRV